ncbi:MAG: hypothetical protein KF894_07190 [Labilithrix sp.]|nr:hypothetical protein [Labilithrix sp.]
MSDGPAKMEEDGEAIANQRTLNETFRFWIDPEIERRKTAGSLPAGFQLHAAQVILNVGAPTTTRINEEVRAVMLVSKKPDTAAKQKGDPIFWDEIQDVSEVQLTDLDPNAAHVTVIRIGARWLLTFDFRYNAARVEAQVKAAEEFFDCAENARVKGHVRAFMENLFAAAELTAKARLMFLPDEKILKAKSHGFVATRTNQDGKLGNVDQSFVELLNRLIRDRGAARYLHAPIEVTSDDMKVMADMLRANLDIVARSIPKRANTSR